MEHRGRIFRFADVEVREGEFSVIKAGEVLPVEPKAYKVLEFLLRNPGRAIPKDEILDAVWNDCEVSESSLTRSIAILRRLLGDDVHEQRFIATVATVGYRFVHPVEVVEDPPVEVAEAVPVPSGPETPLPGPAMRRWPRQWWWAVAGAAVVLVLIALAWWRRSPGQPVVEGVIQLTDDGNPKLLNSPVLSDGSRIYFNELRGSILVLAQVAAKGGQTGVMKTGIYLPWLQDIAPDSSSLLIADESNLFLLPLPAGEPRRLPRFEGFGATMPRFEGFGTARFSPGGKLYLAKGRSLYIDEGDDSDIRKFHIDFPNGVDHPAVSPDGIRIRASIWPSEFKKSLWEVNSDGGDAHPLLPGWQTDADTCCGRWTTDGKWFVFQSRLQGRTDLWALPEPSGWLGRSSPPLRLTNGPLSYEFPFPSRDGKHLYALGLHQRGELVRYDWKSGQFLPYLSGISAMDATVSRDGKWIAYMSFPDHNLWRIRPDGSERLQLTYPPTYVETPRISPDGTQVSYTDANTGTLDVISTRGGVPQKIMEGGSADWSPGGTSLVVTVPDATRVNALMVLKTVEVQTGKTSVVPDSRGIGGAFWPSQDMLVAAASCDGTICFETFNFKTGKWSHLVTDHITHWMQSGDGRYLYYTTRGEDPKMLRVQLSDGKVEEIGSLRNFRPIEEEGGSWVGVTADGDPLLTRDIGTQEIYDLSVRWP
jgi:DNA-binding winged helix-turn-helix (wHTH) protein